ncbi:MAG: hypothetical protein JXD22_11450 [Sedimentisphaerales bacterium]|nr:hypothetical protein [Sedimentisphaerales bacterium]
MSKKKALLETYQDLKDYIKSDRPELKWIPSPVNNQVARIIVQGDFSPIQTITKEKGKQPKREDYCVRFKGPSVLHPRTTKLTPNDIDNLIEILDFDKSLVKPR